MMPTGRGRSIAGDSPRASDSGTSASDMSAEATMKREKPLASAMLSRNGPPPIAPYMMIM
jgi:hypothetical protein